MSRAATRSNCNPLAFELVAERPIRDGHRFASDQILVRSVRHAGHCADVLSALGLGESNVLGTADKSLRVAGDHRGDMSATSFGRDHLHVKARLFEEALLDGEIERYAVHGVDGFGNDEWLERLCQNSRACPHDQSNRHGNSAADWCSLHGLSPLLAVSDWSAPVANSVTKNGPARQHELRRRPLDD